MRGWFKNSESAGRLERPAAGRSNQTGEDKTGTVIVNIPKGDSDNRIRGLKDSPANYHLDTNDLIESKRADLSEPIINAMLDAAQREAASPKR